MRSIFAPGPPRESIIEKYLIERVSYYDGECLKNTGQAGVLDRLIILPGVEIFFCETKRLGEDLSKLQEKFVRRMDTLGVRCFTVDSAEKVDAMLAVMLATRKGKARPGDSAEG